MVRRLAGARRRIARRGSSLIELVVAMAVFGIFLLVLVSLAAEYRKLDRQVTFAWFLHPDDMAVATRVRRDVLDSRGYPDSFGSDQQTPTTLLLGWPGARVVVWKFGEEEVRREEWKGANPVSTWTAKATRRFEISAWEARDGVTGVRLRGTNADGRVVVDRIFAPRPH